MGDTSLNDIKWLVDLKIRDEETYKEYLKAIEDVTTDLGLLTTRVLNKMMEADK